jgi:hypothetical protein
MANVAVIVTEEDVKVQGSSTLTGAELERAVDEDIAKFDECFQKDLDNEPLVRSEVAILKTYLLWKTHPEKFNATQEGSAIQV